MPTDDLPNAIDPEAVAAARGAALPEHQLLLIVETFQALFNANATTGYFAP